MYVTCVRHRHHCRRTHHFAAHARLEAFVKSRSEWCISRQRVWGVPIPSLHHIPTDRAILSSASLTHILSILEAKGVKAWWDDPVEDFVPRQLHHELGGAADGSDVANVWKKGTDTMDVWFDSGSSWSLLRDLGVFTESPEAAEGQIADVYLEGSDQHRGWFQSSLLTATACQSKLGGSIRPYGALLTHGMVLDQEGKKMSKSIGNIISPMTVINGGKVLHALYNHFKKIYSVSLGQEEKSCLRCRCTAFLGSVSRVLARHGFGTGCSCSGRRVASEDSKFCSLYSW